MTEIVAITGGINLLGSLQDTLFFFFFKCSEGSLPQIAYRLGGYPG